MTFWPRVYVICALTILIVSTGAALEQDDRPLPLDALSLLVNGAQGPLSEWAARATKLFSSPMMQLRIWVFMSIFSHILIPVAGMPSCTTASNCELFSTCIDHQCVGRSLWAEFNVRDAIAIVVIFFGAMLAAGGGLGGGGIFIPALVLIVGMQTKQAVPVSQAAILGGAIVNMIMNSRMTNPRHSEKSLVDYAIVAIFTPMLLLGTTFGVMLNVIFPSYLVTAILIVTMITTTCRTGLKAVRTWRKEQAARDPQPPSEDAPMTPVHVDYIAVVQADIGCDNGRLLEIVQQDNKAVTMKVLIVVIWLIVLAFTLIRTSKSKSSSLAGVKPCSAAYWGVTGAMALILIVITGAIGRYLGTRRKQKLQLNWHPDASDVDWTAKNVILYPLFSSLAGLLGGLLGIGGGMVLAPLLLELGLQEQVVSASSATSVLITASSATILYVILGLISPSYSIVLFVTAAIATFLGQTVINHLIKKYNRTSFITGSIALLLAVATVFMTISGVMSTIESAKKGTSGFLPLC